MIKVKTLTDAYSILMPFTEEMSKVEAWVDMSPFILAEFDVYDDGGNNGIWRAEWYEDDRRFELIYS